MDSEEAALRLPNALIGALTVIPLFLLTAAFFDRWHALLAAAFWAVGINAITHNRIGKEDSLLVFFMLFAFYFFVRAKQISPVDNTQARSASLRCQRRLVWLDDRFEILSSLSRPQHAFSSQLSCARSDARTKPGGKTPGWFFLVIIGVFLFASPAVLMPEVWQYMNAYMGERLLTHSGYLFAGQLYKNNMSSSPFWGTPIYFYLLFLAIKVPLSDPDRVFDRSRRSRVGSWRHVGHAFLIFMFLFWIVPYSLIGGKWLRYTLSVMPFVYMLAAVGVVGLIRWVSSRVSESKRAGCVYRRVAVRCFSSVHPRGRLLRNRPHYALYTNALGRRQRRVTFSRTTSFTMTDCAKRSSMCANTAPAGATIAHETPAVARHYLGSLWTH